MPPNYDFHNSLSPREFEELVQDILEIKEKVNFEISGRGKDGGVDLRYWDGATKIVVQVKCYQNNYRQLIRVLKNQEKQKAKAQKPTRYILVTSMDLELTQRDEIFSEFDGLITSREDIIDRRDLNKLLGQEQYQTVERNHYKLWLSSTGVLSSLIDEIVHRDILADSISELEEIKKTVQVFVQNPSFSRTLDTLERYRYVLISGEPGIGKTTLGRTLAAYYLQRKGYREFVYADTVGAARRMYKEQVKQVFFIDDFWGDTFKTEKHPHNEEKHLLKFIRRVSESPNKILILTSREYVLQQGLVEYQDEQMRRTLDLGKCFIQLEDYSELVKAKILFNHLYFSRLEWQYVNEIANNYEQIITHSNYNPRIIETFLNQGSILVDERSSWEYYREFISYLREPLSFWKSLFIKQTFGAQLTTLILFLSSQPMRLEDLKTSYYSCIGIHEQSYRPIQELEFESIIAQLEKTMIKTYYGDPATLFVSFQNSSIKDFLYHHLAKDIDYYGKILIQGCPFFNQLLFMFKTTDSKRILDNWSEEDHFSQEKIRLNDRLQRLLYDRIMADFDTLKYSFTQRDVYEHRASIYTDPEECVVRKLREILFFANIKSNPNLKEFLRNKIQLMCDKLHNEEYPFSYDDMVEFPYLVQVSLPLGININPSLIITDYYTKSRFSEHLLHLLQFEEIFPQHFSDFKETHYKSIKRNIKSLFLEDVEWLLSDWEHDRIDYLVDIIYPQILESYKLRDSKKFQNDLKVILNDYYQAEHEVSTDVEEANGSILNSIQSEELNIKEKIQTEKNALLGITTDIHDDIDVINFIHRNVHNVVDSSKLVSFYENEQPWYIWPFFSNVNRLSLLIDFIHEQKMLPQQSASYYEKFASYLLSQYCQSTNDPNIDHIVDMFAEFAYDMMLKGQVIFSEHSIRNYTAFKSVWNGEEIDETALLSFSFIVQRGKWYEFQTLAFQAYLSVKNFLKQRQNGNTVFYSDFLKLNGAFMDIQDDIWLLCSELDLKHFNKDFLVPILKKYLNGVDETNLSTLTISTFKVLDLTLSFKLSEDTYLPYVSGSCCDGLVSYALEFIGYDLLNIECFVDCFEVEDESKHSELLRLSQFLTRADTHRNHKEEFDLDLVEHSTNPELLGILEALGVCEFLKNSYYQVLSLVEKAVSNNYQFRLDSYYEDPKVRKFTTID